MGVGGWGSEVMGLGFGVWVLGAGVYGLGFGLWGLRVGGGKLGFEFREQGVRLRNLGSGE